SLGLFFDFTLGHLATWELGRFDAGILAGRAGIGIETRTSSVSSPEISRRAFWKSAIFIGFIAARFTSCWLCFSATICCPRAPKEKPEGALIMGGRMHYDTNFKCIRDEVSPEEWQTRLDLAACYRLVDAYGMTDLIYNHITSRIPGTDDHLLINLYGLLYKEITASSLVKIDLDG